MPISIKYRTNLPNNITGLPLNITVYMHGIVQSQVCQDIVLQYDIQQVSELKALKIIFKIKQNQCKLEHNMHLAVRNQCNYYLYSQY